MKNCQGIPSEASCNFFTPTSIFLAIFNNRQHREQRAQRGTFEDLISNNRDGECKTTFEDSLNIVNTRTTKVVEMDNL